jgi:hypothetical protein
MAIDTFFGFDSSDVEDARWISRVLAYRQGRASGVPLGLVRRVKRAKVGAIFVTPLANAMTPDQHYTAAQLAGILGEGWTAKRVAAKLNVLGRPEKRYNARIFQRPAPGTYALTPAMQNAILNAKENAPANASQKQAVGK